MDFDPNCPPVTRLRRSIIVDHHHAFLKVARYSFSRPIPPKFEHKQSFGKIVPTVVLDKDENLL